MSLAISEENIKRASKFIDLSPTSLDTTFQRIQALENLRLAVICSNNIDEIKFLVPECYLTDLVFTINATSLKNFFNLRLSKSAHYKIRELAQAIFSALPPECTFLFEERQIFEIAEKSIEIIR